MASYGWTADRTPMPTARPFSVGFWVRATAVGANQCLWGYSQGASANNYYSLRLTTTAFGIVARGGGTENSVTGGTWAAGSWYYLVARFITATNDRLSIMNPDGSFTHLQRTTTRSPTAPDTIANQVLWVSGAPTEACQCLYADVWMATGDIQADGAQLNADLHRELARKGPLAIPHVRSSVLSFRRQREPIAGQEYACNANADGLWARGEPPRQYLDLTPDVLMYPHPDTVVSEFRAPTLARRFGII